ncbi:MAG: amidohydrolase [Chloroflexi bacterium]|nr:amidohydrolase [Chloroflexota bacterium]
MRIDIHNHFYPGGYLQQLEEHGEGVRIGTDRAGRRYLEEAGTRLVTLTEPMVDLDARFAMMDATGIDVQIMSMTSPNVYAFRPDRALQVARMVNDAYAAAKDRNPDRLRCLASVPLGTGAETEELDRAVLQLGLDGVIVGTNIHGKTLEDPAFEPFWRHVDELRLPVLLHPMTPMVGTEYLDRYALVPLIGFPFDTTLAVMRLVWSGSLERFPNVRFIASHAGGALPYLIGRFEIGYDAYPECRDTAARPAEALKRIWYDTISYHAPALRCLADSVGTDRMVFGTDYPHVIGDAARVIASLEAAGFSADELDAIYYRNFVDGLGFGLPRPPRS